MESFKPRYNKLINKNTVNPSQKVQMQTSQHSESNGSSINSSLRKHVRHKKQTKKEAILEVRAQAIQHINKLNGSKDGKPCSSGPVQK